MGFYEFAAGVMGVYTLYFAGMIGYDLYMSGKTSNNEDRGEDIDISDSVDSYVPKDAEILTGYKASEKQEQDNPVPAEENEEENQKETIEVNYCGGFSSLELKKIFEEETGENFFRGIIPATA